MSADHVTWFQWACCGKRRRIDGVGGAPQDIEAGRQSRKQRQLLDINKESVDTLQKLPGVSAKRAEQIVELRSKTGGKLHSLRQLDELPGFGEQTMNKIGRFAYVSPESGLHSKGDGENKDAEFRHRCGKLLVGSWNVRNLGRKALETGRAKDVAKIVAEYDVIALLELRDSEVVDGLVEILGPSLWAAALSTEVGTDHHKEVYAYLYRKNAIELVKAELLEDPADKWVREPFLARFKTSKGFDFILAAVHIVWGDTVADRRREVEGLGKKFAKIREWDGERDVMLLGDFNTEPQDKAWNVAREAGWMPVLEGEHLKSMVGDTHLYDNIWISSADTANSEWLGAAGVIDFDNILNFGPKKETRKNAIKELSDHRPIWALFATDVDDDESKCTDIAPLF